MGIWESEIERVLQVALGTPETMVETAVLTVRMSLTGLVVLLNTGDRPGLTNMSIPRAVIFLVILVGLALVVAVALRLYAIDKLPRERQGWSVIAIVGATYLIAMIPILCRLYRANYIAVLMPVSVSVLAMLGARMITRAAFDGIRAGGLGFGKVRDRARTHDGFLNR